MRFWIDVEDSSGNRLGDGPIVTASSWEYADRLDRAGSFMFSMLASDPRAALIQAKRRVRCWGIVYNMLTELGSGIIDKRTLRAAPDGKVTLDVSGDSMLRALVDRQVGSLAIDDGAGGPVTSGPADIMALAPAGWSLDVVNGYDVTATAVLHTFEGESVLTALVRLAELTGEHFRQGDGLQVVWMKTDQTDSGIRAVQSSNALGFEDHLCLITDVEQVDDSFDLATRIYPYGRGSGDVRIDLVGLTGWSKTGYTLAAADNYIKRNAAETTYGRIDRYKSFKDILDQTTLADAAYAYLARNSSEYRSYRIGFAGVAQRIYPGNTIQVVYHRWVDGYHVINLDADLVVLEAITRVDAAGLRTVGMQVATVDRWPVDDATATIAAEQMAQIYYTHPQPVAGESHHASHENGGGDELSVAGLNGVLADAQTPAAHTHPLTDLQEAVTRWRGSSSSTPASPAEGDIWNDTTSGNIVKIYANSGWRALN